jgi:signal transduction histidine kinase
VAAYRIVTEALTNVVRHSHARSCEVALTHGDGWLVVQVMDDGVGIDGRPDGVGMHSMRERAAELGGTTVIVGRPGGGTVMTSRIPLTEPSS